MKRLLTEPLLHFLLVGAALFAVYTAFFGDQSLRDDQIVVPASKVEHLAAVFGRTWQRPPTADELKGLIDEHVRDELAYREGVALGLDRDDTIIRRRVRQKLDFIAEDLSTLAQPTDAELAEYLADHPERFRVDLRVWFRQVFLDPDRHPATLDADAAELLQVLSDDPALDSISIGDQTMLGHAHADRSSQDVAERFGQDFADAIYRADTDEWFGPVSSAFGQHIVRIDRRDAGRLPELNEIRATVEREWDTDRRRAAVDRYYDELLEHYTVNIDWPTPRVEGAP